MPDFVVALLFGVGCGGWIYSKVSHRTGNNYKTSIIVSAVSGLLIALVVYISMKTFIHG